MKKMTRRDMLKTLSVGTAGVALVACAPAAPATQAPAEPTKAPEEPKAEEPTKAPEPTKEPPKAAPVKITLVESWFGVPQYSESLDPVTQAISSAMQSAGVTLVRGDLRGIARARRLSRSTMKNIRQNLFFAFLYNSLGVPIAGGILYPFFGLRILFSSRRFC